MSQLDVNIVDGKFLAREVSTLNPRETMSANETDSLEQVLKLMNDSGRSCVTFADESGKLTGILTEKDAVRGVLEHGLSKKVESLITKDLQTVSPNMSIADVFNKMASGQFRHMPIVDEESKVTGIISVRDLVQYVSKTLTNNI